MKKIQSQKKIKQMQSTIDAINVNRVDSSELAELESVDSDKVDYIEVFDRRIKGKIWIWTFRAEYPDFEIS